MKYKQLGNEQPNAQPNAQATEQPDEQPTAQATEHIKTKLNLLFNYIINNNGSPKKIKIPLEDKENIIMFLKKLDIYIENPKIIDMFPEEKILEYKLLYWAIKEIYYSPQKILLNSLTREQLYFRYYKSKKYMDLNKCSIYEFAAYFITCLDEEMERGNRINDRKNN